MKNRRYAPVWIALAVLWPNGALAQNFLPFGSHDGPEGGQHNFLCTAEGWAVDPDDRETDLEVRVLADGEIAGQTLANEFRSDLEAEGICAGGTCGFRFLLWGRITPGFVHSIGVQARDAQTGEWAVLASTPRLLRCFGFSLTVFDFDTKVARVVANLPYVSGHFGPHWSPDGSRISFTAVGWKTFPTEFFAQLYITNLVTGTTNPVERIPCANNLVWSPDGRQVAFQGGCQAVPDLFVASADGESPRLVRAQASFPDWSPDGRRLVFIAADGSLRTIDLRSRRETFLGFGFSPAWSPDGRWVAYHSGLPNVDIWKIRVSPSGIPIGASVQLTSEPLVEGHPSWSADSRTIFFHSETRSATVGNPLLEEFHLWSISSSGGDRRDLTEMTGMGVDVAAWRNGNKLAYGGAPLIPDLVILSPNPATWSKDVSYGTTGKFTFIGAVAGLPFGGVVLDGSVSPSDISFIFQITLDEDSTPIGGTPGSWVGAHFLNPPDSGLGGGSAVGWIPGAEPDSLVDFVEGLGGPASSAQWLIMNESITAGRTSNRFFFSIPSASVISGLTTIIYRIVEDPCRCGIGVASAVLTFASQGNPKAVLTIQSFIETEEAFRSSITSVHER
jgi:hypothetical protein